VANQQAIFTANAKDKKNALSNQLDSTLQARLNVEGDKFTTLLEGLDILTKQEDIVGKVQLARFV
jgi:gamma-glutamyl phosphate reductase